MAMHHSPRQLDTLVDKLAGDDAFRAYLMRDPASALDSIGISVSPDELPSVTRLPSKDVIGKDRALLREKLDSTAAAIPFVLSGKI